MSESSLLSSEQLVTQTDEKRSKTECYWCRSDRQDMRPDHRVLGFNIKKRTTADQVQTLEALPSEAVSSVLLSKEHVPKYVLRHHKLRLNWKGNEISLYRLTS